MGHWATRRAARALLCFAYAASILLLECISAEAWQGQRSPRQERDLWLQAALEKVDKDSERLLTLTEELRKEAEGPKSKPLSAAVLERVVKLEKQARELREAVEALDENFLSVEVVEGAHDIREEAKSLGKLFAAKLSGQKREKLRRLAREIEKRADSVYDRMRRP
jgi:hypothetical protein